jgi:hypothetical protein
VDASQCHLNGPVLEEVFVWTVRWTLKDHPELEVLSEYRVVKTFESVKTALRYVLPLGSDMNQDHDVPSNFPVGLRSIRIESDPAGRCIRVPSDVLIEQAMVKTIKAVSSWPAFFPVDFDGGMR